MEIRRMAVVGGVAFVVIGVALLIASVTSVGEARGWSMADAFAAESLRPARRVGMLLAALGLAGLVAVTPMLVALTSRTPGHAWTAAGWVAFAVGATLFSMVLGLTAIAMPALGELAQTGAVSPQTVADRLVRQTPIMLGFLGGNLTFLAWVPIGAGLTRSGAVPAWVGWMVAVTAVTAWLSFLHVPVVERYGGALWPLSLAVLGVVLLRLPVGA